MIKLSIIVGSYINYLDGIYRNRSSFRVGSRLQVKGHRAIFGRTVTKIEQLLIQTLLQLQYLQSMRA